VRGINLHGLRMFYYVALTESITRTAEMLFISQPAVTMQIRKLEEELGVALLQPRGRNVLLTEAGEEIARIATRLVGVEREVKRFASRYKQGLEGSVRISATSLPANYLLPSEMAAFKKIHSDIIMTVTTANAEQAFHLLLHNETDIAVIGGGPDEPAGVKRKWIHKDPMWFVVSKEHPQAGQHLRLRDILKEPFVVREKGSSMRERLFALARVNGYPSPTIGLEMNGINETIRAVMAGYGVTFVSELEVQDYVERGGISRVYVKEIYDLNNPIGVYIREGEPLPPASEKFYRSLINKQKEGDAS
jgi:DNA-binding transcriptional LysR family regulator